MKKGKFGIVLSFYAILAFAFVILKMPVLGALLLFFVLAAERDEWVCRQVMEAFFLSVSVSFVSSALGWISGLFPQYFFFDEVLSVAFSVISALYYLAALVFSILAILRVMKGQEGNVPLCSDLALRAYGKRRPRPVPFQQGQYPPPYPPQQSMQGPGPGGYQAPYNAPAPPPEGAVFVPPAPPAPPVNGNQQQ